VTNAEGRLAPKLAKGELAAKLKEPNTKDRKFEAVVKSTEPATVLVLVY